MYCGNFAWNASTTFCGPDAAGTPPHTCSTLDFDELDDEHPAAAAATAPTPARNPRRDNSFRILTPTPHRGLLQDIIQITSCCQPFVQIFFKAGHL
ncbi:hypothetical protein GCM10009741_68110 [Kribbella lupini]|uniref:Chitin-binding type-2 domain-containing protein n=1 Tax=Kribbella lupini TaxID=291602 RepID=A0ABN2C7C0_9ACTN